MLPPVGLSSSKSPSVDSRSSSDAVRANEGNVAASAAFSSRSSSRCCWMSISSLTWSAVEPEELICEKEGCVLADSDDAPFRSEPDGRPRADGQGDGEDEDAGYIFDDRNVQRRAA